MAVPSGPGSRYCSLVNCVYDLVWCKDYGIRRGPAWPLRDPIIGPRPKQAIGLIETGLIKVGVIEISLIKIGLFTRSVA